MTATIELYANNAYSVLANSISDTATTINIAPGTGSRFPSPTGEQFFRLTITSSAAPNSSIEIVYVTARSSDALTVIRGREDTVAQSWVVNDLCANEATAGTYNQFMQPYAAIDTGTANLYSVNTPQHETSYYTGMMCIFWTLNTNTVSSPTLNLNGLGTRLIKNADGSALVAGQLPANTPICCVYNSSDSSWRLYNPLGMQKKLSLTASRAVISDSSGNATTGSTTSTEVGYLAGVTSAIQTQLNTKVQFDDFYSGSGYQVLPSGLIIQFGTKTVTGSGAVTSLTSLPVSFTNTAYQIVISDVGPGAYSWGASPVTNSTFNIYKPKYVINQGGSSASLILSTDGICRWIAIGY